MSRVRLWVTRQLFDDFNLKFPVFAALSRPLSEEEEDGDYSPDEDDVKKVSLACLVLCVRTHAILTL